VKLRVIQVNLFGAFREKLFMFFVNVFKRIYEISFYVRGDIQKGEKVQTDLIRNVSVFVCLP
jgi:hypothetical protein